MIPNDGWSRRPVAGLFVIVLFFSAFTSHASAEWKEKVLYSFQGGTDGATPAGGVVFDKQGNLYGATQQGGGNNCSPMAACGTVYQLAPPVKQGDPWTETVLHVFRGKQYNDGEFPSGGVIADAAGNIYGTTAYGGTGDCVLLGIKGGCGTVFELSPPLTKGGKWTCAILYSFATAKQGYVPWGDLVFDSAGNLYGATYFGGGKGTTCDAFYKYCGAIYELSPPQTKGGKWTEQILHSFAGGTDGANPNGGLVLDSEGSIYGTTYIGGYNCPHNSGQGCGTVFKLGPPTVKGGGWTEKQLHVFKNGDDGAQPSAGVILDTTGSLYGGAEGGTEGGGIVFRLTKSSRSPWQETILYSFSSNSYGYAPAISLFGETGDIYGTTNVGPGESLAGSVFRLKPSSGRGPWTISILHGFTNQPDGAFPNAPIILESGSIFGATQYGGTGSNCARYCGTVYEVSR